MSKRGLGLPIEYRKLPELFDVWNINDTTDAKNAVIEGLLKKYNVRTVLDLTCGTGSQVFYLTKHGYNVIGSDFSPALLDIARKKARKEGIEVTFLKGDMRAIQVGQFDAAITIFNAVGHLSKLDFAKAMRNIRNNLKDGGIYIFDICNLTAMTDKVIKDLEMSVTKEVCGAQVHMMQHTTIDRESGQLTSHDRVIIQKNSEQPKTYQSSFSLQIYTATELREILAQNGFEVLEQYDMDGTTFLEDTSLSILTVAQKV
jgi:ubiquinone/menaquinone biosynthesis C-methylase UbiE